jgi:hypothetical protein
MPNDVLRFLGGRLASHAWLVLSTRGARHAQEKDSARARRESQRRPRCRALGERLELTVGRIDRGHQLPVGKLTAGRFPGSARVVRAHRHAALTASPRAKSGMLVKPNFGSPNRPQLALGRVRGIPQEIRDSRMQAREPPLSAWLENPQRLTPQPRFADRIEDVVGDSALARPRRSPRRRDPRCGRKARRRSASRDSAP